LPGICQDEIDLVRIQHEVDRHEDRADPGDGKAQSREGVRIARQHRDTVALADSQPAQSPAEAVADRIHLRKAPGDVATDQCRLGRIAMRGAAQQIADRMLPRSLNGGCDFSGHFPPINLPVMPCRSALPDVGPLYLRWSSTSFDPPARR